MEIKTREDLDRALHRYQSAVYDYGYNNASPDCPTDVRLQAMEEVANTRKQILDALFPKPESERLKDLKDLRNVVARSWSGRKMELLLKIMDREIAAEEESKS